MTVVEDYKNFMEERLCFHKHDFAIIAEGISDLCDGICGGVKTACSQVKPTKVFEQSNLRLQSHPRFM